MTEGASSTGACSGAETAENTDTTHSETSRSVLRVQQHINNNGSGTSQMEATGLAPGANHNTRTSSVRYQAMERARMSFLSAPDAAKTGVTTEPVRISEPVPQVEQPVVAVQFDVSLFSLIFFPINVL